MDLVSEINVYIIIPSGPHTYSDYCFFLFFFKLIILKLSIHRHFHQTLPRCTHPCPHVGYSSTTTTTIDR